MTKVEQRKCKVTRSLSGLSDYGVAEKGYTTGVIHTPYGYVRVYSQPGPHEFSSVHFIHEGQHYTRTVRKNFTHRGLATFGNRLARDVMHGRFSEAA